MDTATMAQSATVIRSVSGGIQILDEFVEPWHRLCLEAATPPFFRPEWTRAYLRAFAPQARLLVTSAWSGQRLLAILPLIREGSTFYGLPIRTLRSPAGVHNCRFDLVHTPDAAGRSAVRCIWEHLELLGGWDLIDIRYAPEGGGVQELLESAKASGFRTDCLPEWNSLFLEGGLGDDWLSGTHRKFRANLRRTRRQIEEQGEVCHRHLTEADLSSVFAFYELENSGWKGREGTAIACNPRTRIFYDEVIQSAARNGYLSLDFLELDGKPVSGHLGFLSNGCYYLVKAAYDENFSRFGPGQLLVSEILQGQLGLSQLDFTGPATWDEKQWTKQTKAIFRANIFRRGWFGALLYTIRFRIRPALKALFHLDSPDPFQPPSGS